MILAANLSQNIPGSSLVELDDMGHYMDLEHHDRVVGAVFPVTQPPALDDGATIGRNNH